MLNIENTAVKKTYLAPETQVTDAEPCYVLAASYIARERYNYLCPYMPENRCREYNHYVRRLHGVLEEPSATPEHRRISVRGMKECPNKEGCKVYETYCQLKDARRR